MRSKPIIVLLIFLTSPVLFFAQDTLFKRNGEQLIVKVKEINSQEIKYKKLNFEDGPLYVESKSAVQEIHFSNGIIEKIEEIIPSANKTIVITNPAPQVGLTTPKLELWGSRFKYQGGYIPENRAHEIMLQTKDKRLINIISQAKDAKSMQYIGFAGIGFGVASYIFFLKSIFYSSRSSLNQNDLTVSGFCLAAAITCPIISGINKSKRNQYNREAMRLYNERYQ